MYKSRCPLANVWLNISFSWPSVITVSAGITMLSMIIWWIAGMFDCIVYVIVLWALVSFLYVSCFSSSCGFWPSSLAPSGMFSIIVNVFSSFVQILVDAMYTAVNVWFPSDKSFGISYGRDAQLSLIGAYNTNPSSSTSGLLSISKYTLPNLIVLFL